MNPYSPPAELEGRPDGLPAPPWSAARSAAAVLALAFVSLGLWLFEVVAVKGWGSLQWVHGFPWASLPVCLCVSVSTLIPVLRRARPSGGRVAVFLLAAAVISLVSFVITRDWFVASRWFPASSRGKSVLLSPILSVALTSVGLHALIRALLTRISAAGMFFFAAALVLVNVLSFLTILAFPALNGARDFVHAVKMGYPVFWVNVLLAASVELALRRTARGSGPPAGAGPVGEA